MADSTTSGKRIDVRMGVTSEPARAVERGDGPFRIALLGDFSGRSGRAAQPVLSLAERRPVAVDRDNLHELPGRLGVEIAGLLTAPGDPPISIRPRTLDDFHPDAIYNQLELFSKLRKLRKQLGNPATFEAAASEVRGWGQASPPAGGPAVAPEASAPEQRPEYSVEGLFDRTLQATPSSRPGASGAVDWSAMIRAIAAPYALPGKHPQQAELVRCVDEATSATMRAILHHPAFQAVETAWRGLQMLVRRLETDEGLKLLVLDLSKDELAADLEADDWQKSGLYKLLVEQSVGTRGGARWSFFAGLYTFTDSQADAFVLTRLAQIAQAAGAPLIAAAHDRLAGCPSLADAPDPDHWTLAPDAEAAAAWRRLASATEASWVGLALPRLLMRLPYGERTDPIDSFRFEEVSGTSVHGQLAWGNPAFACTLLVAEAYLRDGWSLRLDDALDIEDLPLFVHRRDGEAECYPCAECLLSDRAVEELVARRLIPLVSYRDSDRVNVAGIRSLSGKPLSGRWGS